IELAAGVALLVFPVALLVATLPGWFDRQSLARQAARDEARAVVLDGMCRPEVASWAAARITDGGGLGPDGVRVELACGAGERVEREGGVAARGSVGRAAVAVPPLGSVGAWQWTATHTEPVDPYTSRP